MFLICWKLLLYMLISMILGLYSLYRVLFMIIHFNFNQISLKNYKLFEFYLLLHCCEDFNFQHLSELWSNNTTLSFKRCHILVKYFVGVNVIRHTSIEYKFHICKSKYLLQEHSICNVNEFHLQHFQVKSSECDKKLKKHKKKISCFELLMLKIEKLSTCKIIALTIQLFLSYWNNILP